MFKSKPKPEVIQIKKAQQQKSDNRSRAKTACLPVKEDLLLQMKHLKIEDDNNIQTLMKNIKTMKKERKTEMYSPLALKKGDFDKIEIEDEEKFLGNDETYDMIYGNNYEKQIYYNEVFLSKFQILHPIQARIEERPGQN